MIVAVMLGGGDEGNGVCGGCGDCGVSSGTK